MKKFALVMAVVVYAASLTGCSCWRRTRGFFCRGAFCGTPTAAVSAPVAAPAPIIVPQQQPLATVPPPNIFRPQFLQPQVIQPQVIAPHCTACPPCCPCPHTVCDPCCDPCGPSFGYGSGYGGDCCGGGSFGTTIHDGLYLGETETSDDWQPVPTEADEQDPGPADPGT